MTNDNHPVESNDNLRDLSEADVIKATEVAGISLPISDSSALIKAATAVLDQPVSPAEIETALRTAYVTLPLNTPADLLDAVNRVLDVKLGDPGEGEGE
ncbi:hypothetical protein [Novosphingobium gossypii]|uniref:hypothetical protein n=1 Tax=Novosphingobium gossypii TaxID=1604774 RepID=UPI003D2502BE